MERNINRPPHYVKIYRRKLANFFTNQLISLRCRLFIRNDRDPPPYLGRKNCSTNWLNLERFVSKNLWRLSRQFLFQRNFYQRNLDFRKMPKRKFANSILEIRNRRRRGEIHLLEKLSRNFRESLSLKNLSGLRRNHLANRNYKFIHDDTKETFQGLGGLAGKINLKFSSYCNSNKSKRGGA